MARYFFNVYDGKDVFDEVGTELDNIKQVRMHMLTVAMGLLDKLAEHDTTWQMEALDEHGKIVGTMDFSLEAPSPRRSRS